MKILLVCGLYYPVIGGAERECQKHAEALTKRGYQVIVLTQRLKGLKEYEIINGVRVYRAIKSWRPWAIGYLLSTLLFMIRYRQQYDIIQCYGIFYHTTACILMKILFGKKVLNRVESSGPKGDLRRIQQIKFSFLVKFCWRKVDRLIAVSKEIEQDLIHAGVDRKKIVYISNSVDTEIFRPTNNKKGNILTNILFVGRLVEDKRVDILIRSVQQVHEIGCRNIILTIVGDGPLREELERMSDKEKNKVEIRFVGETREVLQYYQSSDILVLPSVWEGLPLVLLEGMACELPIIASDIGGHREVIQTGVNGLLFPSGRADELALRIAYLIKAPHFAKEMGKRGRETVVNQYSLEENIKKYLAIYTMLRR